MSWFLYPYFDIPLRRESTEGRTWYKYSSDYITFRYANRLKRNTNREFPFNSEYSANLFEWKSNTHITYFAVEYTNYEIGILGYEELLRRAIGNGQPIYDFDTFVKDSLGSLHPEYASDEIDSFYNIREEYFKYDSRQLPLVNTFSALVHERVVSIIGLDTLTFHTKISKYHLQKINTEQFWRDTIDGLERRIYTDGSGYGCSLYKRETSKGVVFSITPRRKFDNAENLSETDVMQIIKSVRPNQEWINSEE
jgi:hypothetical protein